MTVIRGKPVHARGQKAGAFRAAQRPNGSTTDGASTQQLTAPHTRVALNDTIQTLTDALCLHPEVQREPAVHVTVRYPLIAEDIHAVNKITGSAPVAVQSLTAGVRVQDQRKTHFEDRCA